MLKDQMNSQASRQIRAKKLSPELNEFLHMLDALEGQTNPRETANPQTR
jgi:hypothetical protein